MVERYANQWRVINKQYGSARWLIQISVVAWLSTFTKLGKFHWWCRVLFADLNVPVLVAKMHLSLPIAEGVLAAYKHSHWALWADPLMLLLWLQTAAWAQPYLHPHTHIYTHTCRYSVVHFIIHERWCQRDTWPSPCIMLSSVLFSRQVLFWQWH